LLDWINNFLEINLDKVEQCATGAVYCNLFDALYPGTIPMSRVDFTVKYEYDYTKNWKLLQNAFKKTGIDKVIPVQRLIKARYQDNLEFLQWMYKYARDTYNGDPDDPSYDALGRRAKSKGGKDFTGSTSNKNPRKRRKESNAVTDTYRPPSAKNKPYKLNRAKSQINSGSLATNSNKKNGGMSAELEQLKNENQALTASRDGLQAKMDGALAEHEELSKIAKDIEKERDFYFNKVCAVEALLKEQPDQDAPIIKKIFEILYETEEDQKNNNDTNMN